MLVAVIRENSTEENLLLKFNRTSQLSKFEDKIPLVEVDVSKEPEIGTAWFIKDEKLGYFKLLKSNWDVS